MAKTVTALFMINTLTHLGVERSLKSYTAPFFAVDDYLPSYRKCFTLRLIPSPRIFGTIGISEQEKTPRIWTTPIMPFDPCTVVLCAVPDVDCAITGACGMEGGEERE